MTGEMEWVRRVAQSSHATAGRRKGPLSIQSMKARCWKRMMTWDETGTGGRLFVYLGPWRRVLDPKPVSFDNRRRFEPSGEDVEKKKSLLCQ